MVNLPIGPGDVVATALLAVLGFEGVKIGDAIRQGDLDPIWNQVTFLNDAESAAVRGDLTGLIDFSLKESDVVGRHIFNTLIDDLLDVRANATEADASDAIRVLERTLGLSAQLPLLFAELGGIAKILLGNRAESFENSALAHLPEELGLNFFMAEILSSLFRAAVEEPLIESINIKHRGSRLDAGTIRRLLQQHKIPEDEARDYLVKAGYPERQIDVFMDADKAFLSISELQEAFLFGIIDETTITDHLRRVGYDDASIMVLTNIITAKAQTQGGDFLRTVARSMVEKGHISTDQFAAILREANVPDASIRLEIEAINLLNASNTLSLTVGEIKSAFQSGILSQDAALQDLTTKGYSEGDANTLIQTWINEGSKTKVSIGENRILSYYLSGVLTKTQALDKLISQGVKPDAASFLVEHPSVVGSVYKYNLTPATVLSALKESVITVDAAAGFLKLLNIEPAEAELQVQIALSQAARLKKSKGATKDLTVADIERGYKLGLIEATGLHDRLVQIGYTSADADLLYAEWYTQIHNSPPDGWVPLT